MAERINAGRINLDQRLRLRDAYRDLIDEQNVNYFVTFNFGYVIKAMHALERLKGFCTALERKALGRNWCKRPPADRLVLLGFPERPKLNPHWHAVARVPEPMEIALKGDGPLLWMKWAARGQLWVEHIEDQHIVKTYSTKRLHNFGAPEDVFIYR